MLVPAPAVAHELGVGSTWLGGALGCGDDPKVGPGFAQVVFPPVGIPPSGRPDHVYEPAGIPLPCGPGAGCLACLNWDQGSVGGGSLKGDPMSKRPGRWPGRASC